MARNKEEIEEKEIKQEIAYFPDTSETIVWTNVRAPNEVTVFSIARILLRPKICGNLTKDADCHLRKKPCDPQRCPLKDNELLGEQADHLHSKLLTLLKELEDLPTTYNETLSSEERVIVKKITAEKFV